MFNIILHEPEIPHNTGAIGRTCAAAGCRLHLIRPLGFSISERALKRAGLDYWHELDVTVYDDLADFAAKNPEARVFYVETCASQRYDKMPYQPGDFFMFGKETAGLPQELIDANPTRCVRVPMRRGSRSLNLSVSVGIVLYEALRQNEFVIPE